MTRRDDDVGARSEARRLVVVGRVQGVGFRAWTRGVAREMGVRGWVRNRADGAVEVHAAGPAGAVESFRELLCRGPGYARVEEVRDEGAAEDVPDEGFQIRY
jgi:acylphosphatase